MYYSRMSNLVSLVTFMGLVTTVLFLVHLVVYLQIARVFSLSLPHLQLALLFLSLSYLLASIGVRTLNGAVVDVFYFIAATWLGIVFLLFSAMVLYGLVHLATGFDSRMVLSGLLIIVAGFSIYALIAGRTLVVREYTVPIEHLTGPLRVVQLSDIHVGTVHQSKYLAEVVAKTNAERPDLVLITGDLFDGSAPVDPEILSPLNGLTAPAYFSNGNHEQYEGLQHVEETLKNTNVQLLDNKLAEWNGLQIVGVNDKQSLRGTSLEAVLNLLSLDPARPTILMYHSPSDWEVARAQGVDLMLSGHTHNGQIYPFNLLVRLYFKYVNGLYAEEGKYLHVSPGTGTWGPPMRLGSRNQITVLDLVPAGE